MSIQPPAHLASEAPPAKLPRVAVLLATYNGRPWIAEQVASILAQRDVELTIHVSDDGSTDGTREWIEAQQAEGAPLRMMPMRAPSGSSAANFARLISEGDYTGYDFCALADQDDLWSPGKLGRAVRIMAADGIDGYSSSVTALFEDGRRRLVEKSAPQRRYDHYFESPGPGCSFVLGASLMKELAHSLAHLRSLGPVEFDYHDWFIYAYARRAGYKWYIDPEPTMLYRQHARNVLGANIGLGPRWSRLRRIHSGWYLSEVRKLHSTLESLASFMPNGRQELRTEQLAIAGLVARTRFFFQVVPEARRGVNERLWLWFCTLMGILR